MVVRDTFVVDVDVPATLALWYDLLERLIVAINRLASAVERRP